jgi:hypothetical protein
MVGETGQTLLHGRSECVATLVITRADLEAQLAAAKAELLQTQKERQRNGESAEQFRASMYAVEEMLTAERAAHEKTNAELVATQEAYNESFESSVQRQVKLTASEAAHAETWRMVDALRDAAYVYERHASVLREYLYLEARLVTAIEDFDSLLAARAKREGKT